MSIESKVKAVELLFNQLDNEINTFQTETKLHCNLGCGKCCVKKELEASPLEFLPWAFHLFINREAENILHELNTNTNLLCYNYKPLSIDDKINGSCTTYKHRGLVCRLFGYAATNDKYGNLRMSTCTFIKTQQAENFNKANNNINEGLKIPIFTDYYMNLSQIDFRLGNIILPVNQALKFAIEEVLQYYSYRDFPKEFKKTE